MIHAAARHESLISTELRSGFAVGNVTRTAPIADGPSGHALTDLAEQIDAKHRAVLQGLRQTVRDARDLGELLNKAKDLAPPGQWRLWVDTHCAFSYETATAYRRIATHWAELPSDVRTIADALAILSHPITDLQATAAGTRELVFPPAKIQSAFPLELQLQLVDPPPTSMVYTDLIADQKLLMVAKTIRGYASVETLAKRAELLDLRSAIDDALARLLVVEFRTTSAP